MKAATGVAWVALAAGCAGGGGGDDETQPIEEYGCVHIIEGDIVDAAGSRDAAPEITPGRSPYRVNIAEDTVGFLRFSSDGEPLVLLTDFAGAAAAVWTGEDRQELPAGVPDPNCDEDIPSVQDVDTGSGEHFLELGPIFQGNVWLMLGS